ncbi:MAG: thioesterase [Chloroflexi bacterium]|nr:thioesterase [Chloroflexota bacterium]
MVRLMERASVAAVDPLLPDGYRSVGVALDVKHVAPTPVGMAVRARAELLAVDGRKLTFRVEAWDAVEKIGEGIHQRAIVELARFGAKAAQKAAAAN